MERHKILAALLGLIKGSAAVIVGLAGFTVAWAQLGLPILATERDLLQVQSTVEEVQKQQQELSRLIWTDKLLDYQARLQHLEREMAKRRSEGGSIDPIYYSQQRMLEQNIREAERQLKKFDVNYGL
jgi:hypothetical protein